MGWEDPMEEDMAPHSSILAWRIPMTASLAGYSTEGLKEPNTTVVTACMHAEFLCISLLEETFV